jgi:hypothetical protein
MVGSKNDHLSFSEAIEGLRSMPEEPTDDQISLLVDIGEADEVHFAHGKKGDLEWLIAAGYAERAESGLGAPFRLTAKALEFLGKRGVGLNEG